MSHKNSNVKKKRNDWIRIRCTSGTRKRFDVFLAENRLKVMEDGLVLLLDYYEGKVSKAPVKSYGP